MSYPSPEDIRRSKRMLRWFALWCFMLLAFIVEFGFIFYILLTA